MPVPVTETLASDGLAQRTQVAPSAAVAAVESDGASSREVGGPSGPEPTRYGDWERRGRCIDF